MKKKNTLLIVIFVISIIILLILLFLFYNISKSYYGSQKSLNSVLKFSKYNSETIFSIDKIVYFSSADASIETNSNSSFKISDLYQYTDIAIFLNPNSDVLNEKNTLKSVLVSDIKFEPDPSYGNANLYYKNVNDFATSKFNSENLVNGSITFDTTYENTIDYSKPILYNNCANPITFCYVNSNIQNEYTLNKNISNVSHNGTLLKHCGITLNSISCTLSFTVTITNNLNEIYECPIILNIPLSTEFSTIYDGNLQFEDNTNYKFIRTN